MSDVQNLQSFDPFAEDEGEAASSQAGYVHIRIQQRNGRKSLTTLSNLDPKLDLKRILKAFKKEFCCNGTIVEDTDFGEVIQLQGDQRENIKKFLVEENIVDKGKLKVHGF